MGDSSISLEEYAKLQNDFIESQKELLELTQLFDQYRIETESMEDVQTRQVEMLEQQLEKAKLEKEFLILQLKRDLQEFQLTSQKVLVEKEKELQTMRSQLKIKDLTIQKFIANYQDEGEKKKIKSESDSSDTATTESPQDPIDNSEAQKKNEKIIFDLKKDLAVKDFLIDDLGQDIQKNRKIMEEQKSMFQKFSLEILTKTKERDQALQGVREKEIEELKAALHEKDEQIEQLELQADPGVSEEENKLMREMILQQQQKLTTITKSFTNYREESEKLFNAQIELRDKQIEELLAMVQLKKPISSEGNGNNLEGDEKQESTESAEEQH